MSWEIAILPSTPQAVFLHNLFPALHQARRFAFVSLEYKMKIIIPVDFGLKLKPKRFHGRKFLAVITE